MPCVFASRRCDRTEKTPSPSAANTMTGNPAGAGLVQRNIIDGKTRYDSFWRRAWLAATTPAGVDGEKNAERAKASVAHTW